MAHLRIMKPRAAASRLGEELGIARERFAYARRAKTPAAGGQLGPELLARPFVSSFEDRGATRRLWMEHFPESVRKSISIADCLLKNRIPLFSDVVDFGGTIDWHTDYRSGKRAPLRFYSDLHAIDPAEIGDAKNIWELNRHNFLLHLAKAYFATNDARYYEKWKEIVLSWIAGNPYHAGINWESSIELAIRAINWIWSGYFFSAEIAQDGRLLRAMYETLFLHGDHIDHHLSRYFSPNTHLTAEALGLVYLGTSFPAMKRASRWAARGAAILDSELDRQVLDDGGYFEMATYYHKYTVDFYVHYLALREAREEKSPHMASKIKKLVKHIMLISEPEGVIPLIGDSDGGELLSLGGDKRNAAGSCCAAAVLLGDEELASLCDASFREEALWLAGAEGFEKFGRLKKKRPASPCHSFNAATGLFCFRTGLAKADTFITIDCGPHGWGSCGHAHSDLLSFEWYCDGTKVIVDPGTYSYHASKELRDAVRSSQRHNTITINDVSQSIPGGTFKWKKVAHPRYALARSQENYGYFEGEHDAYESIGCRHARVLLFFGAELVVIMDFIKAEQPLSSLLHHLQFGEGALREIGRRFFRFEAATHAKTYGIKFLGAGEHSVAAKEGAIYPDYNASVPAPRLELLGVNIRNDCLIVTILGEDMALVQSFDFMSPTFLAGKSTAREYGVSFSMPGSEPAPGGFGGAISVLVKGPGEERMMLRNSKVAKDASDGIRFESAATLAYCGATVRNRTLSLSLDDSCRSFSVPGRMEAVILNGEPVPFRYEKDLLIVDAP